MIYKMGCSPSAPDPNLIYGDKRHCINSESKAPNGILKNGSANNGTAQPVDRKRKDEINKTIKGDVGQWREARLNREKTMKDRHKARELAAVDISDKVMGEKELLSLVSSRSRMTSRATSRTATPRGSRANGLDITNDGFLCKDDSRKDTSGEHTRKDSEATHNTNQMQSSKEAVAPSSKDPVGTSSKDPLGTSNKRRRSAQKGKNGSADSTDSDSGPKDSVMASPVEKNVRFSISGDSDTQDLHRV